MRVFCPEHKRGFFAPRQSPIKCENRGHILGELDFAGERKSPFEFQWQYCCNCEHFSLIDFDQYGLQRCPVCTRRSSTLFVCDRCYTLSFESNTPLQTKNFTLSVEGAPKPCCPGCLQPASADLREHECEVAATSFVTALTTCPICRERLDVGPSFPASVAHYLRRTRAANKVYVTFDYETELFVPIDDGEFVVIRNNDDSGRTFVIPRSPRLGGQRDFYELYQDYYHCALPGTGEINIAEPALVTETGDGWKFESPGILEVVNTEPKKISPPVAVKQAAPALGAPTATAPAPSGTDSATPCAKCGTLIEGKYSFCWKCGHPRASEEEPSQRRPARTRLVVSAAEDEEEADRIHQKRSMAGQRFPWPTATTSERKIIGNRSVLKLFLIPIGAFLAAAFGVFALMRPATTSVAANAVEPTPVATEAAAQPANTAQAAPSVEIKPASLQVPETTAEDTALERLRQMRAAASAASDRSKVLQKFSESERKYANDYRFPYERARVAAMDHKRDFHQEAFAALSRAATKAIHSGKASEMLENLNKDKNGDFQKLSHGHREWSQIQKALEREDPSVLNGTEGF